MTRATLFGVTAMLAALAIGPALAEGVSPLSPPYIAPVRSHPLGQTYSEWAARWWQWALETPLAKADDPQSHPLTDPTGAYCDRGQLGPVWFLAGTLGSGTATRTCTIPKQTALFFPLVSEFYGAFVTDPEEQRTEEFIRDRVACAAEGAELFLEIDGTEVTDLEQFFVESVVFDVQLPEDNVLGATEEDIPELFLSPSVAAGYFIFLYPLPAGEHTIRWTASTSCGTTQDVTYHLTVGKRRDEA